MSLTRFAASFALLLLLAACASGYDGPITNAPDTADSPGPPLLNGGYAP